jgi:hypothetical protein
MRSPEFGNRQFEVTQVASLGQSSGESASVTSQPSPLATGSGTELLHELYNVFAAVLINAQVLDGKLPSYSRSKRYIHEIERSAQRGGALLKRFLDRLPADGTGGELASEIVPPVVERAAVASQGLTAATKGTLDPLPPGTAHAAPDFFVGLGHAHTRV